MPSDTAGRTTSSLRSSDRTQRDCVRRLRRVCDPRPVRRPDAACSPWCQRPSDGCGCDPRPVRRPDAAIRGRPPRRHRRRVAILVRSEDRTQPPQRLGQALLGDVAILVRSEDRTQQLAQVTADLAALRLRSSSGPKTGRSHTDAGVAGPGAHLVAILVRSEDRTQHASALGVPAARSVLRSSSGPKTGRSPLKDLAPLLASRRLRSSSGPKTGRSARARRPRPGHREELRSSSGPKTGRSDPTNPSAMTYWRRLRSSSGPKTGRSGTRPAHMEDCDSIALRFASRNLTFAPFSASEPPRISTVTRGS